MFYKFRVVSLVITHHSCESARLDPKHTKNSLTNYLIHRFADALPKTLKVRHFEIGHFLKKGRT